MIHHLCCYSRSAKKDFQYLNEEIKIYLQTLLEYIQLHYKLNDYLYDMHYYYSKTDLNILEASLIDFLSFAYTKKANRMNLEIQSSSLSNFQQLFH